MLRLSLLFGYSDCVSSEQSVLMIRLWAGRLLFQFPAVACRPSYEPTLSPILWVKGTLSPSVKRPKHEADHLPARSAEVKDE